jgi:hypothetical protein
MVTRYSRSKADAGTNEIHDASMHQHASSQKGTNGVAIPFIRDQQVIANVQRDHGECLPVNVIDGGAANNNATMPERIRLRVSCIAITIK